MTVALPLTPVPPVPAALPQLELVVPVNDEVTDLPVCVPALTSDALTPGDP